MATLDRKEQILLKVGLLAIERIHPYAQSTQIGNRVWEAFNLGKEYRKLQPKDSADKKCHVCGVSLGEKHLSYCSVGPDIFHG